MNTDRTERELRAERLGAALRGLSAELIEERRNVAELEQRIAQLKASLSRHATAELNGTRPRAANPGTS